MQCCCALFCFKFCHSWWIYMICFHTFLKVHYIDVITGTMASQITSFTVVYSIFYSGTDQGRHQSSMSLASVRGIYRWLVNSPHKGPVIDGILPKGPYPPCLCMADRAFLAGYPRNAENVSIWWCHHFTSPDCLSSSEIILKNSWSIQNIIKFYYKS